MASKIITLNVGGIIYSTFIRTLTRYPDSVLGRMFIYGGGHLDPSNKDEHGRLTIDRDGPMFRHVLNFLRAPSLTLPEDFKELKLLRREAEFFQIKPLIEAVDKEQKMGKTRECIKVEMHGHLWTFYGKQDVVDQIMVQRNILPCGFEQIERNMTCCPLDISVTAHIDFVDDLSGPSMYGSNLLPEDIWLPLASLGFALFFTRDRSFCDRRATFIFVRKSQTSPPESS